MTTPLQRRIAGVLATRTLSPGSHEIEPRAAAYHACVTRDPVLPRRRVTDALAALPVDIAADVYLCGGNAMIRDASALLLRRGVPAARIFSEPYFFW